MTLKNNCRYIARNIDEMFDYLSLYGPEFIYLTIEAHEELNKWLDDINIDPDDVDPDVAAKLYALRTIMLAEEA